jgi:hypothetical protein
VPFAGANYEARSPNANAQQTLNLYVQLEKAGARDAATLYPTPGLRRLATPGYGPSRGDGIEFQGATYHVIGNELIKLATDWTTTIIGTIKTLNGYVSMAKTINQLMLVDGQNGWIWDGTDFSIIDDLDFPVADTVTMLDGYFIVNNHGTGQFNISALRDGLTWAALDYATAESSPDALLGLDSTRKDLYLFGALTTEVYYNSGNVDFPFVPYAGGVIEWGLHAPNTLVRLDTSLMWLGKNKEGSNVVLQTSGMTATIVSNRDIEWQIRQLEKTDEADAYAYQQGGHTFYVLSFTYSGKTFVFDVSNGLWHTRSSGGGRHRSLGHVFFNNTNIVGDYENGNIYALDPDVYTDDGKSIRRMRRTHIVHADEVRVFHRRLELYMQTGVGLVSGQGVDPQILLRFSDDAGNTWSSEIPRSLGKLGEYGHKVVWTRLGSTHDRIYEIVVTDPVNVVIVSGYVDIERGAF